MNWQDLFKQLERREKNTTENYINERDDAKRDELQQKIIVYREVKRDILNLIKKEEKDYAMAQRQAKKAGS